MSQLAALMGQLGPMLQQVAASAAAGGAQTTSPVGPAAAGGAQTTSPGEPAPADHEAAHPRGPLPIKKPEAATPLTAWTPAFHAKITQNYESLPAFWTATVLSTTQVPQTMRLQGFTDLAIKLGCRHPSEKSVQTIVASYLLANQGEPCVMQLTSHQRNGLVCVVKEDIRRAARRGRTNVSLQTLPNSPQELRAHGQTHHLYAAAYQNEGPVTFPYTAGDLRLAMDTVPLRMPKKASFYAHQHQPLGMGFFGPQAMSQPVNVMAMAQAMTAMAAQMTQQSSQQDVIPGLMLCGNVEQQRRNDAVAPKQTGLENGAAEVDADPPGETPRRSWTRRRRALP